MEDKAGVERVRPKRAGVSWSGIEKEWVKNEYRAGMSISKIAQSTRRSCWAIQRFLEANEPNFKVEEIIVNETSPDITCKTSSPQVNIENRVYIRGTNATDLTDEQILAVIANIKSEIKSTKDLDIASVKVNKKIAGLESDVHRLVAYLDGR